MTTQGGGESKLSAKHQKQQKTVEFQPFFVYVLRIIPSVFSCVVIFTVVIQKRISV